MLFVDVSGEPGTELVGILYEPLPILSTLNYVFRPIEFRKIGVYLNFMSCCQIGVVKVLGVLIVLV